MVPELSLSKKIKQVLTIYGYLLDQTNAYSDIEDLEIEAKTMEERIEALEGVVECVIARQEILNTGKVVLQMFPAAWGGGYGGTPGDGVSGEALVKKIQAVEKKMKKALKKLGEV